MARDRESLRAERRRRIEKAREAYMKNREKQAAARGPAIKQAPFDPAKYVEQLRRQSWASVHTVLFASVLTTVLVLGGRAVGAQAFGAFAALLLIGSLYYYLKVVWDIDLTQLGKPTATVGVWLTYFVTWLMLSFLLSNPPLFDEAAPVVRCCSYLDNPQAADIWVAVNGSVVNDTDGRVRVGAQVFDNAAVASVTADLGAPSGVWTNGTPMQHADGANYRLDLSGLQKGSYTIVVRAHDTAGLQASTLQSFTVA